MTYDFDCVVIGAGIAGMTAAIYLKKANLNVLILDKDKQGGLLNKISSIENYPGFTKISGIELAEHMYEQLTSLGIEVKYGNVKKVDGHRVMTDLESVTACAIIIATGRTSRKLEGDAQYKNLSDCVSDDSGLYRDKVVAVIGGGNSALEEALYLAEQCKKVIILNRSNNLRADDGFKEQVLSKENTELILDCSITKINAKKQVIYEIETNKGNFKIDALYSFIGYEPVLDFLEGIEKDNNYIVVDEHMRTNIDYIYACGDIIKKEVYRLSTAIGEAAIAAVNVKKSINREKR